MKKLKSVKRPVYNFVFGNVLGKKAVFLIQNIFPTIEKYIEKNILIQIRMLKYQRLLKKKLLLNL